MVGSEHIHQRLAFLPAKPAGEMSMVEIAEHLERVTAWIEAERAKERDARKTYDAVAKTVESNIAQIRAFAQELVATQGQRMNSFSGLLGTSNGHGPKAGAPLPGGGDLKNISDAILRVWDLEPTPLSTEEIADLLPDTGYVTNAAPTSLRSSINQALAKLCGGARVIRFRADGSRIPPKDKTSRARKYLAASKAPPEE